MARPICIRGEAPLAELLADPIFAAVMAADGTRREEVLHLLSAARRRIAVPPRRPAPISEGAA